MFNVTIKRQLWDIRGSVIPEQGIHTKNFIEASFRGSGNRKIHSLARSGPAYPWPFQMVRQEWVLGGDEGLEVYNESQHFSSVGPWVDLDRT